MIDFTFISRLEGSTLKGYVPDPDGSQSGVTIASGFDIGQRSAEEIKEAFSLELADKLLPYVGKIRQEAADLLEDTPLEVTAEEETQIANYCNASAETKLKFEWSNSSSLVEFETLEDACQTVVASVAFQYGNLRTKTPNFWNQIISGDWHDALANLRHFGDKYPTRRNKEADLLEQWLES